MAFSISSANERAHVVNARSMLRPAEFGRCRTLLAVLLLPVSAPLVETMSLFRGGNRRELRSHRLFFFFMFSVTTHERDRRG